MPATTHLTNLHASMLKHLDIPNPVPQATLQQWLSEVNALSQALEGIQPAIQQVVDVTDALALTGQLLGADHPTALDADKMRCLLEPLCERLEWAGERIRQVL